MAVFPYSISFSDSIKYISESYVKPPNADRKKFRCKHKNEPGGYDKTPPGMPEVRPSFNAPSVYFTEKMQWMTWYAMSYKNSTITKKQWRAIYDCTRWATNQHGWDCLDGSQRADYVNGYINNPETGKKYEDPQLMKAIIMGGSLYTGEPDYINDLLWMVPGVDAVDANSLCSWEDALRWGWYFECISWEFEKNVSPFPQGNGGHVYSLFFLRQRTSYPLSWFQEWTSSEDPDPLKYYL